MAEKKNEQGLADFSFDDDVTFFGIKGDGEQGSSTSKTIKEVKKSNIAKDPDADELPDNNEVTNLDDEETDKNQDKLGEEDGVTEFFGQKVELENDLEEEDIDEEEEEEEEETEDKSKKTTEKKPQAKPTQGTKKTEKKDTQEAEEGTETEEEKEIKFFTQLAKENKTNGVFQHVEIKEDDKIDIEKFFELQDQELEARLDAEFESFATEMDEDGKSFIAFKRKGGKTEDWFATYDTGLSISEYDEENPAHVQQVLNYYLSTKEGLDADELADRLKFLKEGGKEKIYATKYFKAIEKEGEDARKELVSKVEEEQRARQSAIKAFNQSLSKTINTTEEVHGIKFTSDDKKSLDNFITKPTVKVGKTKFVPEFQSKLAKVLRAETEEDRQKLLVLGKILRDDFNFENLVTTTTTKVAKTIKSKLREAANSKTPMSSGGAGKKGLADYF